VVLVQGTFIRIRPWPKNAWLRYALLNRWHEQIEGVMSNHIRILVFSFLFAASLFGCATGKLAPAPGDPVADFPAMQAGDKYVFSLSSKEKGFWEVVAVDRDGSFLMKELLETTNAKRKIVVNNSYKISGDDGNALADIRLSFPLFPGKEWTYLYNGKDRTGRKSSLISTYSVKGYETITTTAGPLDAFKINVAVSGAAWGPSALSGTVWYAPTVKMIVKTEFNYRPEFELVTYSLVSAGENRQASGALVKTAIKTAADDKKAAESKAAELTAAAKIADEKKTAEAKAQTARLAEENKALELRSKTERENAQQAAAVRQAEEKKTADLKAEIARLAEEKKALEMKIWAVKEAALRTESEARTKADLDDIDKNIPKSDQTNPDAIAVIIGNRDYKNAKRVDFAINDAESVRKYLISTLGYKEGNIFFLTNVTKSEFEVYFGNERNYMGKLHNAVKAGRSDVFIYYSGHGAPGLKDRKGYFVPIEADPQYLELNGYPLDTLYQNLAKIPARSVTVVLDACFSGAAIFENISPIVLETENASIQSKNMVVLASSSGTQVSSWYNDKGHGLFTYFLLRALKDKNADLNHDGELTFDELYFYLSDISEGVPYYARRINGIEQKPTISGQYHDKIFVKHPQ
jgi:hypothetical protein